MNADQATRLGYVLIGDEATAHPADRHGGNKMPRCGSLREQPNRERTAVRTKKALVSIAAILSAAVPNIATADSARFTDPNDTHGKLDVKAVGQSHDGRRLLHTVRTFHRWRSRALAGDETYIGFYLDAGTNGTRADRFVWVRWKEGRGLYAEIFRPFTHANSERLGPIRVSRANRRSVEISLRRSQLSKGIRNGYTWRVTTSYEKTTTDGACGENRTVSSFPTGACIDNVPGLRQEGFRHDV